MAFLPSVEATLDRIRRKSNNYARHTVILWIPRYETKDIEGTIVSVFVIEIDMYLFALRLSRNKFHKVYVLLNDEFNK